MAISKKVIDRIALQLKRYQAILGGAKDRDISESDTVLIIADMLADLFGYKKHLEITSEFAIRGTYCDLAVKVDNDVRFLIEAKAIGVDLKDSHIKQAIDYAANYGIEWVILTNGIIWHVYKIYFRQPIEKVLIFEINLLQTTPKNQQLLECFCNLSREGFTKSSMSAFSQRQQATNRFSLAALLTGDAVLATLRKELKKIGAGNKTDVAFLKSVLQNEVLKREVVDSEEAKSAAEFIKKAGRSAAKSKPKSPSQIAPEAPSPIEDPFKA